MPRSNTMQFWSIGFICCKHRFLSFLLFFLHVLYHCFLYLCSKRVVYFLLVDQPQEHRILSVTNAYSHSGTQLLSFTSRPTKMGRDRVELPETEVNRFTICLCLPRYLYGISPRIYNYKIPFQTSTEYYLLIWGCSTKLTMRLSRY